jgi:hypothetical protein
MRGLNMTYQTNKVCESTFGSREATYPYYNKDCDKYTVKLDFNEGGSIPTIFESLLWSGIVEKQSQFMEDYQNADSNFKGRTINSTLVTILLAPPSESVGSNQVKFSVDAPRYLKILRYTQGLGRFSLLT